MDITAQLQLTKKGALDFIEAYKHLFDETYTALALAQARMKISYDEKRKLINLQPGDQVYLKLAKSTEEGYYILNNFTKLSFIKEGPFKILRKITSLSYELKLPDWLYIHPVVTIDHLKPVSKDPYKRSVPPPGPIHDEEGNKRYIIEKIHSKEMRSEPSLKRRQA